MVMIVDFNCPDIDWDDMSAKKPRTRELLSVIEEFALFQRVRGLTREQNGSSSWLDLLFVTQLSLVRQVNILPKLTFSNDHCGLQCLIKLWKVNFPAPPKPVWISETGSQHEFRKEVASIAQKHFRLKKVGSRCLNRPSLSQRTIDSLERRDAAFRKWTKTKDPRDYSLWVDRARDSKRLLKASRTRQFRNIATLSRRCPDALWKDGKRSSKSKSLPPIPVPGAERSDWFIPKTKQNTYPAFSSRIMARVEYTVNHSTIKPHPPLQDVEERRSYFAWSIGGRKACRTRKEVEAVFQDCTKAFDRVPHEVLVKSLQDHGINGDLVAPQVISQPKDCRAFRESLDQLGENCAEAGLSLNPSKSQHPRTSFKRSGSVPFPHGNYSISGQRIATESRTTCLRVVIDRKLNWTAQVDAVIAKCRKRLHAIRSHFPLQLGAARQLLCKSLIRPVAEYTAQSGTPRTTSTKDSWSKSKKISSRASG
ncbi:hypothetical protein RvY_03073 [Ramazzottius varieornatus]|uniref:Endonuclease/exonuclease/phosphatase domain-containing protein n=1 Tax=Ramazzottius varieornatus TaxID=947166 RepID=A0A1D1UWB9_RAMVA|nr:hypothetical protein RvY_03073 [Ramazzottius varieornatus]